MVFAFNYGGRKELVDAVRSIADAAVAGKLDPDSIDESMIAAHLYVPDMPDPDVVIRTSGEQRTSNFLLWEAAYSEYVFTEVLWPDFGREELVRCIHEYQDRERRFGGAEDESLDVPEG
jgi:undecaprenyl diphosphate synthase